MAREVNDVDLDKITFLKLPVRDMTGDFAGRVALIEDRAQLLFDKIANDEPLVLAKANVGTGAVVAEEPDALPTPQATATQDSGTTEPTATATEEALPDWVQGTNASVKSCSK
jgi:hypothetical protein